MSELHNSLLELIRRTSAEIPDDVNQSILASLEQEKKGTIAESALKIIDQNIQLAKRKSQPICQDTGSLLFYVDCPVEFDQITFAETAREAVKLATKKGFLRQNSVDSLTGKNDGTNCGPGAPTWCTRPSRPGSEGAVGSGRGGWRRAWTARPAVAETRRAAALGFEVALVRTPHYYQSQMTPDTLAHFYRKVADASPIPILIYSIPQYTGITVEAPLAERLAEHPHIAGIKDSSGSVQRAAEMVCVAGEGFRVLVGSASTFFASLLVGASGGILALADALPDACVELYELSTGGKIAEARALQGRLLPASKALVSRWGATGMKYALDQLGYYGGPVREPLCPLSEAARKEIDEALAPIRAQVAE